MVAVTPGTGVVQGAIVGFAGGTTAGLVYGAITVGPSIAATALLGAIAGLAAGITWIWVNGLGRSTPVV